jgi:hypothetical protein
MIPRKILITVASVALFTLPAMAQTGSNTERNGHHYSGGPKTEGHHMGKRETTGVATRARSSGGHHYAGGPKTEGHHMGEKR